jgi:hypothetical protein
MLKAWESFITLWSTRAGTGRLPNLSITLAIG